MNPRGDHGPSVPHYVPVIDVDVKSERQMPTFTSRIAIWNPEIERALGASPTYFTDRDGGWWFFLHPAGALWFGGRRLMVVRPRGQVTVIETARGT